MRTKRYDCKTLALFLLLVSSLPISGVRSQEQGYSFSDEDRINDMWFPYWWTGMVTPEACYPPQSEPDSGFYNSTDVGRDMVARFGYPYHYALISGINDTLDALIFFSNPPAPEPDYDLTGKKVEQWFAPQAYSLISKDPYGPALRDSTQLHYRFRGWYNIVNRMPLPPITKLRTDPVTDCYDYEYYSIKLDIWNLPEGKFQLCILPTDKIPSDLHPLIAGSMIEFYPARDLADSCNGYEGCYWRMKYDSNFSAAKDWVGKIIAINPTSVPGWWLRADNALDLHDTTLARAAYDSAITYLNSGKDPAMPDSTKRKLMDLEKSYIRYLQLVLARNRAQLGP